MSERNTKREYLLRGMIKCACCKRSMTGVTRVQNGIEYKYYVCNKNMEEWYFKNGKCNNGHIRASILDESVWKTILTMTSGDEDIYA